MNCNFFKITKLIPFKKSNRNDNDAYSGESSYVVMDAGPTDTTEEKKTTQQTSPQSHISRISKSDNLPFPHPKHVTRKGGLLCCSLYD